MRTFKDNAGRTWTVAVNVAAVKRVKALLSVDLLEVAGGELLQKLIAEPVLLCDVLYALCKPEADAQQVTDEQFGQSMGGDALDLACQALLEEIADFFPVAGRRKLLRTAVAQLNRLNQKVTEAATARLESPAIDAQVEQSLRSGPGGSSGSAPESSAPIPAPTPSAS